MSIEYVVGRDYKDTNGGKWKLVYIGDDGSKVFVNERTYNLTWDRYLSIVSEWLRTVTLNGEEVELEPWATCVAMDKSGEWWQYEKQPNEGRTRRGFVSLGGNCEPVKFKNWRNSLIKL